MKSFSAQRGMQCEKQNRATEKNSYCGVYVPPRTRNLRSPPASALQLVMMTCSASDAREDIAPSALVELAENIVEQVDRLFADLVGDYLALSELMMQSAAERC